MKRSWVWLLAALLTVVAIVLWAGLALWLTALSMPQDLRGPWLDALHGHGAPLVLAVLVLLAAVGVFWRDLDRRFLRAPRQLAERIRLLTRSDSMQPLDGLHNGGGQALAEVARSVAELVGQRDALRQDMQSQVQAASQAVQEERNRLAALMAELTQSVVVCNLDGRILLFNQRARLQFRALAEGPAIGGAEPIALGRSIYAVFDRKLVTHAIESVQHRLQRGAAHPSAQFVTGTRMLEALTEASRASLGNLQAAVELLEMPDLDAATRERFQGVVRDEAGAMARRIEELAQHTTQTLRSRWPLEDMRGADLVAAASTAIRCSRRSRRWPRGWSRTTASSCCSCACSRRARARSSTCCGSAPA